MLFHYNKPDKNIYNFYLMKIIITAVGSRGDLQPYLALAQGLKRAWYEVSLSAPRVFEELIKAHGVEHLPISVNPQEIMDQPEVQAVSQSGNSLRLVQTLFREGEVLVRTFLHEVYANCQEG